MCNSYYSLVKSFRRLRGLHGGEKGCTVQVPNMAKNHYHYYILSTSLVSRVRKWHSAVPMSHI